MPKAAPKQPKDAEAFARKGLGSIGQDAILAVQYPDHPFGVITNDLGTPVGKSVEVRVFKRNIEVKGTPCGDHTDGRLFCEAAGSKGAMAAGGAKFELELASEQRRRATRLCRAAAWEAAMYVFEIRTATTRPQGQDVGTQRQLPAIGWPQGHRQGAVRRDRR
jgi:hypothetical protein